MTTEQEPLQSEQAPSEPVVSQDLPQETGAAASPLVASAPSPKSKSKAPMIAVLVIVALVVLCIAGAFVANKMFQKQLVGQIQAEAANALQVDAATVKVDIGDGFALAKKLRGVVPSVKIETKVPNERGGADADNAPMRDVTYTMSNYSLKDKTIANGAFDTVLPPEVVATADLPADAKMECTDDGLKFTFNQGGVSMEGLIDLQYVIGTDKKGSKAFPAMSPVFKSFKASFMGQTKEASAAELEQMGRSIEPIPLVTHLEDKLQVTTLKVSKDGIQFSANCIESVPMSDFLKAAE